ncbi:MAG: flagellar basal body rod protein FlgB [Bacteroidetes bacterium]|nr:flagellar basal body rod protein FlgB [Bacteroidota bacterium]MBU1115159.1 flagellar basal body rod protein FlgB [Bacteroidota bacterium]MBU1799330.1 flagellar basal body rod protein FlgB [Bacteroidota bacterium]
MAVSNLNLLENYIGHLSTKNKVISQNIANIGTEGYIRQNVKFQDMLEGEMSSNIKNTNNRHMKLSPSNEIGLDNNIFLDKTKEPNGGINNVDIETEMAELAENAINFKFSSKKIAGYFQQLREVIKGGGSV